MLKVGSTKQERTGVSLNGFLLRKSGKTWEQCNRTQEATKINTNI